METIRDIKILNIFLLSILISIFPLVAQESTKDINTIVYSNFSQLTIDPELKKIINTSASEFLQIPGLNMIIIENSTTTEELFDTADWLGGDFLIEFFFFNKLESLSLEINIHRIRDRVKLASMLWESNKGVFDRDSFEENLMYVVTFIREPNLLKAEKNNFPIEMGHQEVENRESVKAKSPVLPEPEDSFSVEGASRTRGLNNVSLRNQLYISTAGAPFIGIGELTKHFTIGLEYQFFGGLKLVNGLSFLMLGAVISYDHFKTIDEPLSLENFLFSFGPEMRLGFELNPFASMMLRISTGVSFISFETGTEILDETIPFFSVGTEIEFNVYRNLNLFTGLGFNVYRASSLSIIGLTPGIGLSINL